LMRKVEAVFFTWVIISVAFIMSAHLVIAGQSGPVLIKRGLDCEIWQLNSTHFKWISAPPWVWDGSKYVPYIFEDSYAEAGYYLMRNAYISVRLFTDHAEFWDLNYTEVRVQEEKWLVQYFDGEWRTLDIHNPSFNVITNSSGIFITQSWTVGPPIGTENAFRITYALREARPLEHFLTLSNKGVDAYEFRLVQTWDGIAANSVRHSNGEVRVTSPTNIYSLWFQFGSDTNDFVVFEDLRSTGYYDKRFRYHNDVLQPATIGISPKGMSASFTYSNRSLYTLSPGESLMLDPETKTIYNEYDLSGYIVARGWPWFPGGPPWRYAYCPSGIEVGKEFIDRYPPGDGPEDTYELYRGYVSFLTGPEIDDGATITGARLYMYLLWVRCEGSWGVPGLGFWVDFSSGQNEWSQRFDETIWDKCPWDEGGFVFIYPNMPLGYWDHDVNPNSIEKYNGRTQFRFNMYDEWNPPEGLTKVQRCAFDNPLDRPPIFGGPPKLEVTYTIP